MRIEVYGMAVVIALIASLESLLSVEAADKIDPYKRVTPTNRELFAQGLGNVTSGLIGGLPITAVIVRTSANVQAGGRSKLSAVFHALLLAGCVLAFPTFLNEIPYASLAAILLFVGYKLTNAKLYKGMFKLGWGQFLPFLVTVIAVLSMDLLKGIMVGFAVALFFILKENFQNSYSVKLNADTDDKTINFELAEEVSFLNKASIQKQLENVPDNSILTIDGSKSKYIDYDVLEIISNFKESSKRRGITVITKNLPDIEFQKNH
jgi:MFS superfamily sulfate permease-like transporter